MGESLMKQEKLLTIVTVCFNSEKYIENCIKSIISQMDNRVEYLIIDGKSTDNTLNIIKKYEKDVTFISEKDNGIYDAMNKGIQNALGKWLLFINSDDCLIDGKLLNLLSILETKDEYDCIYGDIEEVYQINGDYYTRIFSPNSDLSDLNKGMILSHPSTLCKRDKLLEMNGFNIHYKIAADWDLLLRMKMNNCKFLKVNCCFSRFYFGGASSKNHIKEKHLIRKNNSVYRIFDFYLLSDFVHSLKLRSFFTKLIYRKNADLVIITKKGFKRNL